MFRWLTCYRKKRVLVIRNAPDRHRFRFRLVPRATEYKKIAKRSENVRNERRHMALFPSPLFVFWPVRRPCNHENKTEKRGTNVFSTSVAPFIFLFSPFFECLRCLVLGHCALLLFCQGRAKKCPEIYVVKGGKARSRSSILSRYPLKTSSV